MNISAISAILLLIFTIQPISLAQRINLTQILDDMFRGYDHRVRPQFPGPPVEVNVTVYVLDISSVSHANMDFTMTLYFRQFWIDERLRFQKRPGLESIVLDSDSGLTLWEPDTFFGNDRTASVHNTVKRNSFTEIHPDGKIKRSIRMTVTATCPMNLRYFPMDSQLCRLEAESYSKKATDIIYYWGDKVGFAPEVTLTDFKLIGHRAYTTILHLPTGSYSRLALDIKFTRTCGYYVTHVYIPTMFMVILSWTAFLIKSSVVRVLVGLMTTLTATILISNVNADLCLPHVPYTKAIDVYTGGCLSFIFVALLVNAVAECLAHAHNEPQGQQNADILTGQKEITALDIAFHNAADSQSKCNQRNIYRIAIIGLPIAFFTFNFLYCIVCVLATDEIVHDLVEIKH